MLFVSNRDIAVYSTHGHSIKFVKGKPQYVPKIMHAQVMEKGILPVDEDGQAVDPAENSVTEAPTAIVFAPEDAVEREEKIVAVFKALVKRNKSTDFTAGGRPAADSVSQALGWRIDQKESNKVWEKVRSELLNKTGA